MSNKSDCESPSKSPRRSHKGLPAVGGSKNTIYDEESYSYKRKVKPSGGIFFTTSAEKEQKGLSASMK